VIVADGIQANNYCHGEGGMVFLSMYLTMNMGARG